MKKLVLNINKLTFGYTKQKLIYQDFNLKLYRGEIKSVVGSSGSGKSTLFELITNNIKPIKGDLKSLKISSIYQDPYSSFHPTYTIQNQLNDVIDDFSELPFLLERFGLSLDFLNKKPHQLSGGQLQRCSIIRAILMKPDLLLADEPTSALDNIIALDVMKVLISFVDRFGILLITHDEDLARWCSDEIINIENNKIRK
ncbi:MAG: ATP-binding cassette domain-containing protein [Arcobacteraceae bacterium]|jgi:peptide/nickel transport system ATP-binding protein